MSAALIVIAVLALVWVALNLKTSRKDGRHIAGIHPYRRMMPFIMQGRNESIVFFDRYVDAHALLDYVQQARQYFHVDVTHCLVGAVAKGLEENPSMNRFIAGRRLYQRKDRQITFSMKRKKLDKEAKLAAVKMTMTDGESFRELCERINSKIGVERSEKKTYLDKELSLFTLLPRAVLNVFVGLFKWLDYHNVLPHGFIENDGMYTSVFIANLGSLGMGPGYHHLYEWGNCPLFLMVGRIEERPVVRDGEVVVRKMLHLRYSYDERIDDGLSSRFGMDTADRVLQNPFEELGGLPDQASGK